MNTPFGIFRWTRLPFGLKSSAEVFQKHLHGALGNLEGLECIADDVIVFGIGDTQKEADINHDTRMRNLLLTSRDKNIKYKKPKCLFKVFSIDFHGHVVTSEGLKPDQKKIEAIVKMPNPVDATEVQRLKGSVTYLFKFLPRLSEVMEPIRKLTHKDEFWHWGGEQETVIREVKHLITTAPILEYYNPVKDLIVQSDASQGGLGTVLSQEGRPLTYASRALTDTHKR